VNKKQHSPVYPVQKMAFWQLILICRISRSVVLQVAHMNQKNIVIKNFFLSILLTVIIIKVTDIVLFNYFPDQGYLFSPQSKALYKTKEFDDAASINKFGFRGYETELTEGQILVIGDSFTFGWGLKDEDVWARLLENKLKSTGLDLKVYNLGVPGTDSDFHLEVAKKYVKKLKPKFVIISVLIDDDFQQVLERQVLEKNLYNQVKTALHLRILFPGLYKFYLQARDFKVGNTEKPEALLATKNWREESLKLVRDKKVFLPDDILVNVTEGNINPALISLASKYPNRAHQFWDDAEKDSPASNVLVEMTKKFFDIGSMTQEIGGKLIIFSMPSGTYVNSEATNNYRKYGFKIPEDSIVTYKPEILLEKIAKNTGSIFVSSLTEFRGHKGAELFFPLDGHLSSEGSVLVANIISKALLNQADIH